MISIMLLTFYIYNDEKNLEDCGVLKQTSRDCNIAHPEIIIYGCDSTLIEEVNQVLGFEDVSIPVRNILMKYNKYIIVSVFNFFSNFFFVFHDLKKQ